MFWKGMANEVLFQDEYYDDMLRFMELVQVPVVTVLKHCNTKSMGKQLMDLMIGLVWFLSIVKEK